MKSLESLNNVEKGKLLHALFPGEMTAAIKFIANMSATILEDEQAQRNSWDNQFMQFDFWLSLAGHAGKAIEKYGKKLEKNRSLFANQLFDGYTAAFTAHCLMVYTTTQQLPNKKFAQFIGIIFG